MKILASDLDGTLFRTPEGAVKDIEAINRFREAGNKFGIASGRGLSSLYLIQKSKNIACDFLLANTTTVCASDGKILFSQKISADVIPALYECIINEGGHIFNITKEADDFYIPTEKDKNRTNAIELSVQNATEIGYCTQISTVLPTLEAAAKVTKTINKRFSETLSAYQNGICIDIVTKGWSKAEGVRKLAEIMGVDKKDVYTLGDNYNDIPMLSFFNGFAVANAPDDVKKHASVAVVPSVADAIEMLLKT